MGMMHLLTVLRNAIKLERKDQKLKNRKMKTIIRKTMINVITL